LTRTSDAPPPAEDVEIDDREVEYDVGHVEEEKLL